MTNLIQVYIFFVVLFIHEIILASSSLVTNVKFSRIAVQAGRIESIVPKV